MRAMSGEAAVSVVVVEVVRSLAVDYELTARERGCRTRKQQEGSGWLVLMP